MIEAIYKRRSVRRFLPRPVPQDVIEKILEAAVQAPSAKNRQPWKFVVVRGRERRDMVSAMKTGLQKVRRGESRFTGWEPYIPSAVYTARILELAPVTIFILNKQGRPLDENLPVPDKIMEICDLESVSAAVQNMSLAATDLGVGSLWTCNIFLAYDELKTWLNTDGEMAAAMAFGYTDKPLPPARREWKNSVLYRGED